MNKALPICLCVFLILWGVIFFGSKVKAQSGEIIVEGADYVTTTDNEYSAELINMTKEVTSRVMVEYSDFNFRLSLNKSDGLNEAARTVTSRVMVQYSDFNSRLDLNRSAGLDEAASMVSSRVMVQYSDFVSNYRLQGNATLLQVATNVMPRILVEYADYVSSADMEHPFGVTVSGDEKSFTESTLSESLLVENAVLNSVSVIGDLNGTLNFTSFETISISTGSFAGKGFSKGEWQATLEGLSYIGDWRGALFLKPSERRIYLKGSVSGEIFGTVEGSLTESILESGTYDQYQATWKIGRLGDKTVSATATLNGSLSNLSASEFPATELYFLQSSIEGTISGFYNGSLSTVISHLRIVNGTPYDREGFSTISFTCNFGTGEGWTYDMLTSPTTLTLRGLFTDPLFGVVSAVLEESTMPRTLHIRIDRVDLGLPPMADLKVKTWGPGRASPGQTITYAVELRNDGFKSAENITLIYSPDFVTDFLSASLPGRYDDVLHVLRWDFENIPPKTSKYLSLQMRILWGLTQGDQLTGEVQIVSKSDADLILQHSSPSLSEWVKAFLKGIWIGIKKVTLKGAGWLSLDIVQFTAENPYAIPSILTRTKLTQALVEEGPNQEYWEEMYRLWSTLQGHPHYVYDHGWQTLDGGLTFPAGTTIQEVIDELQVYYGYCPANRPDQTSSLDITTARDPNVKYGLEGYVSQGQTLDYTIEYENEGEGTAFGVYITETLDEDLDDSALEIGPVISKANGSTIAGPGTYNSAIRTITWLVGEVGPSEGGLATFNVNVRNDAPEGTEIINFATVYFPSVPETTRTNTIISAVGHPNIAITDLTPLETTIARGSILYLNLTVANEGYFAETFNMTIYANSTTVQTQNITTPGRSENTILLTWNTTDSAYGNYTISAYAAPIPGETNIADNTYTGGIVLVTIPGDVNGDGEVDASDLVELRKAYGSTFGSPNWNANCDINGDYKVDVLDLFLHGKNYGKTIP